MVGETASPNGGAEITSADTTDASTGLDRAMLDTQGLCKNAAELLAAGKVDEAEEAYQAALKAEPKNLQALVGLGNVAWAAKVLPLAEKRFKNAAAINPSSARPLVRLVQLFHAQKRWGDADKIASVALTIHPENFDALTAIGRMRFDGGNFEGASAAFETADRISPEDPSVVFDLARTQFKLDRVADAEARYLQCLEFSKAEQEPHIVRSLAVLARKRGDPEQAMTWLQRALTLAPEDKVLAAEMARARVAIARRGSDQAAVLSALAAALEIVPNDVHLLIDQALAFREGKRLDAAEASYRRVLQVAPETFAALAGLGVIDQMRGRHEAALGWFEKARAAQPNSMPVRIDIGRELYALKRQDDAEAVLQSVPIGDKQYPLAQSLLAEIAGKRAAAKANPQQTQLAKPPAAAVPPPATDVPKQSLPDSEPPPALAAPRVVATNTPTPVPTILARGRHIRISPDNETATATPPAAPASAPVKREPPTAPAASVKPASTPPAAERQSDRPVALQDFASVLPSIASAPAAPAPVVASKPAAAAQVAAPAVPNDRYGEAQRLADLGLIDEAVRLLDQAREAEPPSPRPFVRAAEVLRDAGELDRAVQITQQGVQQYPADFDLWEKRASIELAASDFAAVERSLAGAPSETPAAQARVLILRARLAQAKWAFHDAGDLFSAALKSDPTNTAASLGLVHLGLLRCDLFVAKRGLERSHGSQALEPVGNPQPLNAWRAKLEQIHAALAAQPTLSGTLSALGKQNPWRRIVGFIETARRNPDAYSTATALLIELRQSGFFDQPAPVSGDQPGHHQLPIPRVISQFATDAQTATGGDVRWDGWVRQHPAFRHTSFGAARAVEFLRAHAAPRVLQAFQATPDPARQAQLFRLAYLYAEGGIDIEPDLRCRGSVEQVLQPGKSFVACQNGFGAVDAGLIAVAPGHPIIKRALERVLTAPLGDAASTDYTKGGTAELTRACAAWIYEHANGLEDHVPMIGLIDAAVVGRVLVRTRHTATTI